MYLAFLLSLTFKLSAHSNMFSTCFGISFRSGLFFFNMFSYSALFVLENWINNKLSLLPISVKSEATFLLNINSLFPAPISCITFNDSPWSISSCLNKELETSFSYIASIPFTAWPSGVLGPIPGFGSPFTIPIAFKTSSPFMFLFLTNGERPGPFLILGFLVYSFGFLSIELAIPVAVPSSFSLAESNTAPCGIILAIWLACCLIQFIDTPISWLDMLAVVSIIFLAGIPISLANVSTANPFTFLKVKSFGVIWANLLTTSSVDNLTKSLDSISSAFIKPLWRCSSAIDSSSKVSEVSSASSSAIEPVSPAATSIDLVCCFLSFFNKSPFL